MVLTKVFSEEDFAQALEDWAWLDLNGKTPVLASLFGDVFLQDEQGSWFLDAIEGKLKPAASSFAELKAKLDSPEGQDHFLLRGLATAAENAGLTLGPDEVFDFEIPPVLGGKTEVGNLKVMPFVVAASLAGQMHDQIRGLKPGTKISGFKIVQRRRP